MLTIRNLTLGDARAALLALWGAGFSLPTGYGQNLVAYEIGNPTAEEQFYIERVNRTRMNPSAEGSDLINSTDADVSAAYSVWSVDLNMFRAEMDALTSVPPLAPNWKLMAGARLHSADMLNNAFQSHLGSDGKNAGYRITNQGYNWARWGENVYAYALSPLHGHAGFVVDWGTNGTGGMQDPRAHRDNIMVSDVREIGVGNLFGTNGPVGPEIVSQVLAREQGSPAFITGVVYYDVNENGAYDIGEGLGGVLTTSPASSYFAETADAGGYALPVTSNGTTSVAFEIGGESLGAANTAISDLQNTKVDLPLSYTPPKVSGAAVSALGEANFYTFTEVPGATGYDVKVSRTDASSWSEGAENGTTSQIIDGTTGGYNLISTSHPSTGSRSFWLTFPAWDDQSFEIDRDLLLAGTSALTFDSRFYWVTTSSKLYAEISVDGGQSWAVVYERAGTGGSGDPAFSTKSVSLATYAGATARIRFRFRHHNNAYINTASNIGVYLDNITVTATTQLVDSAITAIPAGAEGFVLTPEVAGSYHLEVRPKTPAALPYGESFTVEARSLPSLGVDSVSLPDPETVVIDFTVENGIASGLSLQSSTSPRDGWTTDGSAVLVNLGSGRYRFSTVAPSSEISRFYRLTGTAD